jgi:hypothetical protein
MKPLKSLIIKKKAVIPLKKEIPVMEKPLIEKEYPQDTLFIYDYMEQCKTISRNITAYELTILKSFTIELTKLTNKNDILYKLFYSLNKTLLELCKILEPLTTKRIFRELHNAVIAYTSLDRKVSLTLEELASSNESPVEKEAI